MNAFELISLNQGLNLDNLFEAKEVRTLKQFRCLQPLCAYVWFSVFYFLLVAYDFF